MTATAIQFDPFCLSSFLTFRYVAHEAAEWLPGLRPRRPALHVAEQIAVRDATEILAALQRLVSDRRCGLLLSSGIDSAILAALLPSGTPAYTIDFDAPGALRESLAADRLAGRNRLRHRVVTVTWVDHERHAATLMQHKRAPLHPVEVGLYLAARAARADGVDTLMVGNGADSTFGGLDKLLSRDWTLDEFVARYTFVSPEATLREPISVREVFAAYDTPGGFDVGRFLKEVHGRGIIQAFASAVTAAGCQVIAPYESLRLDGSLDLARIRGGESKYLLRELFRQLYPEETIPAKIAFARPMDEWLKNWRGPQRPEFRDDIAVDSLSGEQKWLLCSLENFLNLYE